MTTRNFLYSTGRAAMVLVLLMSILNLNVITWITYEIDHNSLKERFEKILLSSTDALAFSEFEFSVGEWFCLDRPEEGEIIIGDETYDVVAEYIIAGRVRVTCLCDQAEKEIDAKAERLSRTSESEDNEIEQDFQCTLFPPESTDENLVRFNELKEHLASHSCMKLANWYGSNFVPPDILPFTF